MSTDLVGKTLSQYKLERVIGEGAQAVIYQAYQPSLERRVAVKVLRPDYQDILTRFKREAKAIALLRHRNILVVYDYGQEGDLAYIVTEYVGQGTLRNYLLGRPMAWAMVVSLVLPIADALHYAHGHGLIHRDVKPSNILMPQADWPLLADFGLVKVRTKTPDGTSSSTDSNLIIGTPAYISPEQASGATIDHRADIYSLGVVMFEMVSGRLPYNYKNANRMLLAHVSDPPPSARSLNTNCPPELTRIILTAMQKSPKDRYATMQEMMVGLRELTLSATPITPPKLATLPELATKRLDAAAAWPFDTQAIQQVANNALELAFQEARLLIPDKNISIDLVDPGKAGLIIGRKSASSRVDIDMAPYGALDTGVSRQHARLSQQGQQWVIEDLDSLNHTFVNNQPLTPGQTVGLKNGDVVRCGHLALVFLMSYRV